MKNFMEIFMEKKICRFVMAVFLMAGFLVLSQPMEVYAEKKNYPFSAKFPDKNHPHYGSWQKIYKYINSFGKGSS